MKRLLLAAAVLLWASPVFAQYITPNGYTMDQLSNYPGGPPLYGRYDNYAPRRHCRHQEYGYGTIMRQNIGGGMELYFGGGDLQGLDGMSMDIGSEMRMSSFRYNPPNRRRRNYYGW